MAGNSPPFTCAKGTSDPHLTLPLPIGLEKWYQCPCDSATHCWEDDIEAFITPPAAHQAEKMAATLIWLSWPSIRLERWQWYPCDSPGCPSGWEGWSNVQVSLWLSISDVIIMWLSWPPIKLGRYHWCPSDCVFIEKLWEKVCPVTILARCTSSLSLRAAFIP